MCQLVPWWDCWKLPDGSLSHPLRRLELAAFVSPFCLLQIITGGLLCAFPCGSALKTYPRLILACAPGQGLVIWVLLRGLPRLVLEPVWEPSLPALGLEGWCPGSASPTQVGKGALHTADPPGTSRAVGQSGGQIEGQGREKGSGGGQSRDLRWLLQAVTSTRRQDRHQEWL